MDNSELLGRDLLDRVAEHVGVLEPDVREQDDARADDVRGIVPAAEPGLDDRDVDVAPAANAVEGGGSDRLELRRADALGRRPNARERRRQVRRQAVDPDPLAPRPHVWRERRPDREPFGEQQLLDRDRRRRLPVRPDDVDGRVGELRIAELGEQCLHAIEPEAVLGPGAQSCEPADVVAHAALELRHGSARCVPGLLAVLPSAALHRLISPENASDSACAITSAGVGGWRSISIISSVIGSPLAR